MGHLPEAQEFFVVLRHELRAIVGDDLRSPLGILLPRPLQHQLGVGFLHRLPDLCPADRFFEIQSQLRQTLEAGIQDNLLELALRGKPQAPFYMVGRMDGQSVVLCRCAFFRGERNATVTS